MKNYFKKFSIMFVMALAIIGIGIIQNGSTANAATVGKQFAQPDGGWRRFDDVDVFKNAVTTGNWTSGKISQPFWGDGSWNNTGTSTLDTNAKLTFEFYGSEFRLCSRTYINRATDTKVIIDGKEEVVNQNYSGGTCMLILDKSFSEYKKHTVTFISGTNGSNNFEFDCIDIDENGYLVSPSITLDKSTMDFKIGDEQQLTATTTPASAQVTWTSSNPDVATVGPTGKVTAVKEGTCTITATINDVNKTNTTCTINVSKPTEPNPPTNDNGGTTTGDENLYIQLVNGDVKKYTVTNDEFDKFKHWYQDRVDNKAGAPFYEFNKDGNQDYVVLDKIEWFELRK